MCSSDLLERVELSEWEAGTAAIESIGKTNGELAAQFAADEESEAKLVDEAVAALGEEPMEEAVALSTADINYSHVKERVLSLKEQVHALTDLPFQKPHLRQSCKVSFSHLGAPRMIFHCS